MKRYLPILTSVLIFIFFAFIIPGTENSVPQPEVKTTSNNFQKPARKINIREPEKVYAAEAPVYYPPKQLDIPKIGLSTNVVSLGLDSQNRMDVPNNFIEAGWYNLGYKPGERGSAVIDGHHDDFNGNPAVFYYLSELELGDQILVTDEAGKQFTYLVSDNVVYPYDQLPMQEIFASNDKSRLNLITCEGGWDPYRSDYSHRTVIYSELQQ